MLVLCCMPAGESPSLSLGSVRQVVESALQQQAAESAPQQQAAGSVLPRRAES